ncbi:MAG: OprO/OprP family phosphate-selective porin [Candidatus Gastranaerophilales bacterium]|nr:OprO/OprP family phosphate-selective porin [Candidatus Gastranaerophilales bacterium]
MSFSVKTALILFFFILISPCVFAIEEINLEQPDDGKLKMEIYEETEGYDDISSNPIEEDEYNKPLKDKISDIYHLEISDYDHIEYLMDSIMTKKLEKGPLDNIGIWTGWRGGLGINFLKHNTDTSMDYDILETRLHGDFKNKKTSFVITTRYVPQNEFSFMQNLFSDTFIRHKFNKNNSITIGNSRTHTGQEGGRSELLLPLFSRSQISRNFGNIRKLGVRINGDYRLIDYDIGGYSSGTYFREFFPGAEFCGWVNIKPLGKTDGRFGDLKIGGGLTSGRVHFNYTVVGGYVRYRYKKIGADFEIAKADGYNGRAGCSSGHAGGYYTTLYYNISNRYQLLARYDEFIPDCTNSSYRRREYSAGFNYFIKGQALKFMVNYIFRQDSAAGNSHRILIGTQVLL